MFLSTFSRGSVFLTFVLSLIFTGLFSYLCYVFAANVAHEVQTSRWEKTSCYISEKTFQTSHSGDRFRAAFKVSYHPKNSPVLYNTTAYRRAHGQMSSDRGGEYQFYKEFEVHEWYTCWYDPRNWLLVCMTNIAANLAVPIVVTLVMFFGLIACACICGRSSRHLCERRLIVSEGYFAGRPVTIDEFDQYSYGHSYAFSDVDEDGPPVMERKKKKKKARFVDMEYEDFSNRQLDEPVL